MVISMWVLHDYQKSTGKIPPSVQLWAFNKDLKSTYPVAAKAGRRLEILCLVFFAPYLFNFLFMG